MSSIEVPQVAGLLPVGALGGPGKNPGAGNRRHQGGALSLGHDRHHRGDEGVLASALEYPNDWLEPGPPKSLSSVTRVMSPGTSTGRVALSQRASSSFGFACTITGW